MPACHGTAGRVLFMMALLALAKSGKAAEIVAMDMNLTTGKPADERLTVQGGTWNQGWHVAQDLDRIVLDLGRDITDGYVEVVVTRRGSLSYPERKRNWMGIFADARGHQSPGGYARAGAELYAFSKAEIFAAGQPNTICEKTFGGASDWVLDGKTEHVVRAEIRRNVMTWSTNRGGTTSCGGAGQPVTHFRYVMLGGVLDHKAGWHHGSLVGLTVRRIKVVEYGPDARPR